MMDNMKIKEILTCKIRAELVNKIIRESLAEEIACLVQLLSKELSAKKTVSWLKKTYDPK